MRISDIRGLGEYPDMMNPVTKGVILARGLGTRMRAADPNAQLDQKQSSAADAGVKGMIDVGRPFLDFVISALADVGINQVCLVIGPEHDVVREYYSALKTTRVKISFAIQEQALGTADAVLAAADFVGEDRFIVLNSDNYYPTAALAKLAALEGAGLLGFEREALITSSNIPADRIATFAILKTAGEQLVDVVEKPSSQVLKEFGNRALISMNAWLFTPEIFAAARSVELSERGEYEITDAVRAFISRGNVVSVAQAAFGVLDMSRRTDIAQVKAALADTEVKL